MESLSSSSSKFLISPSSISLNYSLKHKYFPVNFRCFPLIIQSKKSSYQDFQEYAKPSRLLPATEVKVCTDDSIKEAVKSFSSGRSECFYTIKLQTSQMYGSGLSNMNSGILLCLVDENGSSILQRLPAISDGNDASLEDNFMYDKLHFERGSIDEFAFEGPKLGKIVALWISLESGQWRIGGLSLSIIYPPLTLAETNKEIKQLTGLRYNFEVEDILLGESSELPMMEFRPISVTALSEDEFTLLDQRSLNVLPSLGSYIKSNEESMKEYADLKFSLLFYDTVLTLAGSSIASFSAGESAAYAFLTGGMCGFLYLLLLQRSVDGLPVQELIPSDGRGVFGQIFGRLKGPISGLILALAFALITVKYASGEDAVKLTPKDLIFGMVGFLMCKVSVVLAAFKPMPLGLRDNKQSS